MIWLGTIQFLLNAVLAFLAFHVTVYPVDKRRNKVKIRAYYILIVVCILGSGAVSLYQSKTADKDQKDLKQDQKDLKHDLSEVSSKLTQISTLRQQYEDLREQYEKQITYIVTNRSFSPETRQAIIESDKKFQDFNSQADDLNTWLAALKGEFRDKHASAQMQHEKVVKEKQANYQNFSQCFDYAISSFTNLLGKLAALKSDQIDTTLHDLPANVDPEGPIIRIADIKFKKNADWNFNINLNPAGPQIEINGNGAALALNATGGGALYISGEPADNF
jgi:hypothetical protein